MADDCGVTGVVLAGGRGARLGSLTDRTNKHLLPVGGEPMVVRAVRQLAAAGVRDVLVVIDERHASEFLAVLRDGRALGLRSIGYAWQPFPGRGMPSAIGAAEHLLGTAKFVVACGDVLTGAALAEPISAFGRQDSGARLVGVCTADTAGYSRLEIRGDRITAIHDKDPACHVPGVVDLGFYLYHHDVFDEIRRLTPSARGETEIWDLNRAYAGRGALCLSEVEGWWTDAGGGPGAYASAQERYAR